MRPFRSARIVFCMGVASAASAAIAADARSGLSSMAIFDPLSDGWIHAAKMALQGNSTTTSNPETSRDPTISGSRSSAAVLGTVDWRSTYIDGPDSLEHLLTARYGLIRDVSTSVYHENDDEIRYDGTYRHLLAAPHFAFALVGFDTVATGPHDPPEAYRDDESNPFDPLVAKIVAGYGQRYEQNIPDDFLEARLGVRFQRRWESQPPQAQAQTALGMEFYVRYEATPRRFEKQLAFFVQYEVFSEFDDPEHVTNLLTGSLTLQLQRHLQFQIAIRAFYESTPKDVSGNASAGYNEWSMKQDVLLGLTWIL